MLVLNLKTYTESIAENLPRLLDALVAVQNEIPEAKNFIYVAPSMIELSLIKKNYPQLNIISQHVDNVSAGSTTGWTPAENLVKLGIEYSIYNHSEHRVWGQMDVKGIQSKNLKLMVCCENVDEAKVIMESNPFAVAYEPKELIGSGISVTTRPQAVEEFVATTKGRTKILIGAGVTTGEDVQNSLKLGADGVLLASAFVKATDPVAKAKELVMPFLNK